MSKFKCLAVIITSLATLVIVGYCIYFDQKRRKDPQYRRRIYERRQFDRLLKEPETEESLSPLNVEVVKYFLERVYLGEIYFQHNDWNRAIHNFANAIMICAKPTLFLCQLRKAMPMELYEQILTRIRLLIHTSDNWSKSTTSMSDDYDADFEYYDDHDHTNSETLTEPTDN